MVEDVSPPESGGNRSTWLLESKWDRVCIRVRDAELLTLVLLGLCRALRAEQSSDDEITWLMCMYVGDRGKLQGTSPLT
jgi:hypothetical protein